MRIPATALVVSLALASIAVVPPIAPSIARAQRGGGAHTGGAHTGGGPTSGEGPGTVDRFSEQYTEASRAWHDGRYEDALRLFSALYEQTHRPELFYDLGVTYERLDRLEEAIDAFQSYVDALPMARNRMQVENRIASLREDLRGREPAQATATTIAPRTTPPASDRPIMSLLGADATESRPDPATTSAAMPTATGPTATGPTETVIEGGGPEWIVTWPLLALTVAGAIATPIAWDQGWQSLAALEQECAYYMDCTQATIDGSAAKSWEVATNVLLVSTLVLGGATLITFLVEAATPTARREVQRPIGSVRLDVGPGGLSVGGAF